MSINIDAFKTFKIMVIDKKTNQEIIPYFIVKREKLINTVICLSHEYPKNLITFEGMDLL